MEHQKENDNKKIKPDGDFGVDEDSVEFKQISSWANSQIVKRKILENKVNEYGDDGGIGSDAINELERLNLF